MVRAAQRGDRRAEEEVLCRYEPLVRRVVHQLALPARYPVEDLAQEARIGLTLAIWRWQPGRGTFARFAELCVRRRAAQALRNARRNKHSLLDAAVSLDCPPTDSELVFSLDAYAGGARPGFNTDSDPVATVLAREQLAAIRTAWRGLTAAERASLAGALNGKPYRQVADELGCGIKGVDAALQRARRKLATDEVLAA